MWTDLKQTAYLSLTLHYVNDSWELTRNLFFTSPFPKERHTGDNIRMELRRRLKQFGLPEGAFDALMFVSDRGSNMLSALKSNVHFHCFAHVINTVLQKTFQEDYLKSNLPAILSLIEECKQLVRYMKKTGLVSQLKRTLHQQAETRWNTHFDMIISIQSQLQEIGQLLEEKNEGHRIVSLDEESLSSLAAFLKPFKQATVETQSDAIPTVHKILLWYETLMAHCEDDDADCPDLAALKSRAKEFLIQKLEITVSHKIATFLDPRFRQLRMLRECERKVVKQSIKREIQPSDTRKKNIYLLSVVFDDTQI